MKAWSEPKGSISYSVNGGRTEYNNWEVDGGDMMDNGSNFSLNVYPSVEAIEEVQVLTSNYGAQYGKNGSGTVEVETKSGTNQFHGSLWEFARNEAFNAHNYFDVPGTPKAGYKKHDFGYSIGGPIWKNRTFFFWLQNWRREDVPQNFYSFVPSVDNRQGNFTDLCAPKNAEPNGLPLRSHDGKSISQQHAAVDRSQRPTSAEHDPRAQPGFWRPVHLRCGDRSADAVARGPGSARPRFQFQSSIYFPRHSRFLGHDESHGDLGQ